MRRMIIMSTETKLRRLFAEVLASAIAVSGCGAISPNAEKFDNDGGVTHEDGGVQPEYTSACTSGPNPTLLSGITSTPPLDGAKMRYEQAFASTLDTQGMGITIMSEPEDGDYWTGSDEETQGALCSGASNPDACRAKVNGYRALPPLLEECATGAHGTYQSGYGCAGSYILYTRGDEIGAAQTEDQIKDLIGKFDSLSEVVWAAGLKGLRLNCSSAYRIAESQYRRTSDGGYDISLVDDQNCGSGVYAVTVHVDPTGDVTELSRVKTDINATCAVAGRRPLGFSTSEPAKVAGPNAVGAFFASMATLEAASVVAFRRLHRQLVHHGAPERLLTRIRKAARDEIRHARTTRRLAEKYGARVNAPRITPSEGVASLFEVARENAREGCVRETFGALVAQLQATRARDLEVRQAMVTIAREETEHAALSWDLAAWLESKLDVDERLSLDRERHDAVLELAREVARTTDPTLVAVAGIPTENEAATLLGELVPALTGALAA